MNSLFISLGIESWKPILAALILPPVPWLLTVGWGAALLARSRRRALGWMLVLLSVTGLWLGTCTGMARLIERHALAIPSALSPERINELKLLNKQGGLAIVVLGGGREGLAPEYGGPSLSWQSLERLRYGLWLARQTGAPVAFSGGVGWAASPGATTEADIAARIATEEFGRALRWVETQSRDTRDNARLTWELLQPAGVRHVLLVTHGWHMPRAARAFNAVGAQPGMSTGTQAGSKDGSLPLRVEAAPMGLASGSDGPPVFDWLPSGKGYSRVHSATREVIGRWMGS